MMKQKRNYGITTVVVRIQIKNVSLLLEIEDPENWSRTRYLLCLYLYIPPEGK